MSIAIAYVHPGHVSQPFARSLANAARKFGPTILAKRSGPLIAPARNALVRSFLEGTTDSKLLFVDSDINFEVRDVERLDNDDLPVVSGLYYGMNEDGSTFPVAHQLVAGMYERIGTFHSKDKPFRVDAVGMGFCLIRREVLVEMLHQKSDEPLWPFAEIVLPSGQPVGEDVAFCWRCPFKISIDPRVKLGHIKSVEVR